jgi:cell division septation protein DedD
MSKPELYKDKIEVALDGRQIFYLFFGGAVIVGMVFVLGVVVGRRVEARGHSDAALAAAASKSDPLAALDKLDGKGTTYQNVLTAPGATPPTKVEAMIANMAPKKASAASDDAKKPAAPVADPVAEDEKPVAAIEPPAGDAPPKVDVVTPAPVAVAKHDDADAAAKKHDDDHPAKKSRYALQLASFQDKSEAETFLSNVKSNGFSAQLSEADVAGKGTFYRVRLGNYKSLEAANDAKADYDKGSKKPASVMKL